jgi:hypothetical protein
LFAVNTLPSGWAETGRSTLYSSNITHNASGLTLVQNTAGQHSGIVCQTPLNMLQENSFKFKFNTLPEIYGGGAAGANGFYIGLFEKQQMYWYDVPYSSTGKGVSVMLGNYTNDLRVDYIDIGVTTQPSTVSNIAPLQAAPVVPDIITEYTVKIKPDASKGYIFTINDIALGTGGTAPDLSILKTRIAASEVASQLYLSLGINSQSASGASFTITELNGVSLKIGGNSSSIASSSGSTSTNSSSTSNASSSSIITKAPQPIDSWVANAWPGATGISSQANNGLKIKSTSTLPYGLVYNAKVNINTGFSLNVNIDKITGYYGDTADADYNSRYFVLSIGSNNKIFRYNTTDHDGYGIAILFRPIKITSTNPTNHLYINMANYYIPGVPGVVNNSGGTGFGHSPSIETQFQSFEQGKNYKLEFKSDSSAGYALYMNGTKIVKMDGSNIDLNFLKGKFTNNQVYVSFAMAGNMESTITRVNGTSLALTGDSSPESGDSKSGLPLVVVLMVCSLLAAFAVFRTSTVLKWQKQ